MKAGPDNAVYTVISQEYMGVRHWAAFNRETSWVGPLRPLDQYDTAARDREQATEEIAA